LKGQLAAGQTVASVNFSDLQVGNANPAGISMALATQTTGANGQFTFTDLPTGAYAVTASRGVSDALPAINTADALAALKIAVGQNPNADPDGTGPLQALKLSPYQIIAADVTGTNNRVDTADALAILKMAVRSPQAVTPKWVFLAETLDLWNEDTNTSALTRLSSGYDATLNVQLMQDRTVNLVGVLTGDVNGSFAPAGSQDLDITTANYFQQLAQQLGVPTDIWGI